MIAPLILAAVLFDGGGRIGDYLDVVAALNASDAPLEIEGVCASACTMKLGVKRVCIHANAQLWFHSARSPITGNADPLANAIMMQEYPPGIRAWVERSGALQTLNLKLMSGAEAIGLGVRDCGTKTGPGAVRRAQSGKQGSDAG